MGRELWSQAGEPTWAIDERLRRLEDRVDQLAAVVAELVAQQAAQELAAAEPAADRPGVTGPGVTEPVGSSGRTTGSVASLPITPRPERRWECRRCAMNDNPTQRVVIAGIDGSDPVLAAVDLAAAQARRRRLPLRLLATAARDDAAAPTDLTAVLRLVSTTWPGLPTSGQTVTGALAEEVIDASRGAGLVVIGRPDRRAHHPLGGDEVRIAAHSQCPTVVCSAGAPVIPDGAGAARCGHRPG